MSTRNVKLLKFQKCFPCGFDSSFLGSLDAKTNRLYRLEPFESIKHLLVTFSVLDNKFSLAIDGKNYGLLVCFIWLMKSLVLRLKSVRG